MRLPWDREETTSSAAARHVVPGALVQLVFMRFGRRVSWRVGDCFPAAAFVDHAAGIGSPFRAVPFLYDGRLWVAVSAAWELDGGGRVAGGEVTAVPAVPVLSWPVYRSN